MGLEQREQGGSTRRRFQEVNGISFEGSFNDRVRWGVMGGFEQINNMSQKKKSTSQDGGVGRYTLLFYTTKLKTKSQPELPENQTLWKSDNQGVKEETFNQMGRKGRDRQPGQRGHETRWQLEDWEGKVEVGRWAVPHLCLDNLEVTTGKRDRPCHPRFQRRKRKPQNLWL